MGFLIVGNICQAALFVMMNVCFNNIFGVLNLPLFTMSLLARAIGEYLFAAMIYTTTAFVNSYATEKLIHHLDEVMTQNYISRWLNSKTYFGANFLAKRKVLNPAIVLSQDIQDANQYSIRLGDSLINAFFLCLAGVYGLWGLSSPLTFQIASMVFMIPGYTVLGAILYAITYNLIVSKIGYKLHALTNKQHQNVSQLQAQIHHVEKNAESIELLQAREKEKKNFFQILQKGKVHQVLMVPLQAGLYACWAMNEQLHFFVGMLIGLPQLIAKTISIDCLMIISDYFTKVVGFFSWQHDNYEDLTHLSVLTGKLHHLQEEIAEWEVIRNQSQLKFSKGHNLNIDSLTIQKPDQSIVLNQKQFHFNNRKVTLIQGPSGVGKSTLFRALTGLWPYVSGKITLPVKQSKMHMVAQKPYFPMRDTLYEAILYPHGNLTANKKKEIYHLMKEFKLSPSVLKKCDKKNDWAKILSGGEQQRIALIRAIMQRPLLLLMDEPFSALDPALTIVCERLLKKHLPKTTIIYIDHHSVTVGKVKPKITISPLYQHRITLQNKQLVEQVHKTKKVSLRA